MAPTSQKAEVRPISFLLSGGNGGDISLPLVLRPEDLTKADPSRLSVQQTLGGAWADNFGPGISSINISGHTGWRGGFNADGVQAFFDLRDVVFAEWHARRADAVSAGINPDEVRLIFADSLDNISVVVAPGQFVLKRNRARPLLMMYQLSMTVLSEDVAPETFESDGADGDMFPAGLDSLSDSIDRIVFAIGDARQIFSSNVVAPVQSFLGVANAAMGRALSALGTVDRVIVGQTAQLVGFAQSIALAGRNAMYTYNAVASQTDFARLAVCDVASAFDNAYCVLSNVFRRSGLFPDYSDIYGASNCSSTSGGSPMSAWRLENAFEQVLPNYTTPLAVTPLAQSNISILRATDPVLAPLSLSDLSNRLSAIGGGVTFP